MVDFETAFKRPFTDIKKLVIGIVLQVIPIVNLLALGYQLNCARTAMGKDFKLPEWEDWGKLFVKGLLAVVITVIYILPALIVLIASVGMAFFAALGAQGGDIIAIAMGSIGIGALLGFLLMLLAAYVLPAAILSYVKDDKIGSAFKFKAVSKKAFKVDYLVVWIVMTIYEIILVAILSVIPIMGSAAGTFIASVTSMTAFGEVYPEL